MELPEQLQILINESLDLIRRDLWHHLDLNKRQLIYDAFGQKERKEVWYWESSADLSRQGIRRLELSKASRVLAWLSFLQAQRVKPIWEAANIFEGAHAQFYFELPAQMLGLVEELLLGTADTDNAKGDYGGDFYYFRTGLEECTLKPVYLAMESAVAALEVTLFGTVNLLTGFKDVAGMAVMAYAENDENEPGIWRDYNQIQYLGKDIMDIENWPEQRRACVKDYRPIGTDPQKELEFWEWWLIEAIPQAWKLSENPS